VFHVFHAFHVKRENVKENVAENVGENVKDSKLREDWDSTCCVWDVD
jgi:hypothetical protein